MLSPDQQKLSYFTPVHYNDIKQPLRNFSRGTLGWVLLFSLYTFSQSPARQSAQNQRWLLPREDTQR